MTEIQALSGRKQLFDFGTCLHTIIFRLLASYLAFSLIDIADLGCFEELIQQLLCLHAYFVHLSFKFSIFFD